MLGKQNVVRVGVKRLYVGENDKHRLYSKGIKKEGKWTELIPGNKSSNEGGS